MKISESSELSICVEKNVISKANALIFSKDMSLTKRELIIFDCYLSLINPKNRDSKTVVIKKKKLEQILGTKVKTEDLKKNISNLMKTQISIANEKGEWFQAVLFQNSKCFIDEDNEWSVSLTCSDFAMEYMFDISNIGYTRFQLKDILSLQSPKAILLFEYLLANKYYHRTWEVSLKDLREQLDCKEEYYNDFNRFNTKVLRPCVDSINQTCALYSVDYIKILGSKRNVESIQFILNSSYNAKQTLNEITENELQNHNTNLLINNDELPF